MTDQTMPLPITAAQVQLNRRKGQQYRARCADLDRALRPALLHRTDAIILAARMSSWPDAWPEEREALLRLRKYHGLTNRIIHGEPR